MKTKNRTLWLLILVVVYSAWAVTSVSAHALLLRSNPEANAVLEKPPVQVELYFSESLEPQLSSISVLDTNGVAVDVGDGRPRRDDQSCCRCPREECVEKIGCSTCYLATRVVRTDPLNQVIPVW